MVQRSAFCRPRRELSNAYVLANFGFDTAENEPCKVLPALRVQIPQVLQLRAASVLQLALYLLPPNEPETAQVSLRSYTAGTERAASVKIKWKIKCS